MGHHDVQTSQAHSIFDTVEQERQGAQGRAGQVSATLSEISGAAIHPALRAATERLRESLFDPQMTSTGHRMSRSATAGHSMLAAVRDGDQQMVSRAQASSGEAQAPQQISGMVR